MTIQRMDNVLIVVDDIDAVISFFVELGMELDGEAAVEGESVDQLVGLAGLVLLLGVLIGVETRRYAALRAGIRSG